MNKEFITKGGISYTVYYKTYTDATHVIYRSCALKRRCLCFTDDATHVIYRIHGTLDDGSIDAEFEIPTPTDEAKRKALEILGLNEDYWRFAE